MPILIFYAAFICGLDIAEVIPSDFEHFDAQRPKSAGPCTRIAVTLIFLHLKVYRPVIWVK